MQDDEEMDQGCLDQEIWRDEVAAYSLHARRHPIGKDQSGLSTTTPGRFLQQADDLQDTGQPPEGARQFV